jgi:hypothetical protein
MLPNKIAIVERSGKGNMLLPTYMFNMHAHDNDTTQILFVKKNYEIDNNYIVEC